MSDTKYAPAAVIAARDKLEAVDKQLAAVKDEQRAAELALKAAVELDKEAGAQAVLNGKTIKDPFANKREAQEQLDEINAKVDAATRAYGIVRADLYATTAAGRPQWLADLEEPDQEGREKLAAGLALVHEGMEAMTAVQGVRAFLENFTSEGTKNRHDAQARQKFAMRGPYWPAGGRLAFPNPVKVNPNEQASPAYLLSLLTKVLEKPQAPVVAEVRTEKERTFSE